MTEPLQVGQFAIVDHEPVDRGPNAGIFHGKGPADDRAELYIVAEGTTPAGEAFAGHVVSAVGHAWNTLDMSLTGALRRLFGEAQRNLRDWNQKSIAQHRVSIGLTCFARRGTQAVIAQAGPSAAFHFSGGRVHAYFPDEEHAGPIGTAGSANPQLTRIHFADGDRLLLISTAALRELDDEVIGGILSLPTVQVLPDLYHRLQHVRHLTAVLVTPSLASAKPALLAVAAAGHEGDVVIDATAGPAPGAPHDAAEGDAFQPSLFIASTDDQDAARVRMKIQEVVPRALAGAAFVPATIAEIPAPLRRAAGDTLRASLAAQRQARLVTGGIPSASTNAPRWRTAPGSREVAAVEPRHTGERRASFSRGLVREEPPPRPARAVERAPLVDDLAAGRRARATMPGPLSEAIAAETSTTISSSGSLVRVRGSMGGRWKSGGGFSQRSAPAAQLPPTWLVIVVGLGILLALVGFLVLPGMLKEQESQRYARLVDTAQQKLSTARVQQDPGEKRKALTEAHALLLEAREADAARPEATQLIDQVAGAISAMDAVKTPAAVDIISDLTQYGEKAVVVSRLTLGNDTAYLLDNSSNQVIAVTLATGEKKVVYSEDKDAKRGRPVASAFLDASDLGPQTLLIFDSAQALWAYSPTGALRRVVFAPPQGMSVTDIATFGRDLYVLDASESVVYRFAPGDGGYGVAPAKVLSTPDLAAARRIAVDSAFDGEILASDANGTLRRFSGQLSLVLSEAGIDRRLAAAEPPQPIGASGDIAVLDAPGERVVVFRRDGAFDRQYRHKDFQAGNAFAVRNGTAYVFSGGKLRRITW